MLRKKLKANKSLVRLYQRIFLPERPALAEDQWVRIVMDRSTEGIVKGLIPDKIKALEVSGRKWGGFGFKDYMSLSFPEFDLCSNVLDDKFDLVIAEQVFEHLSYPYRAGRNVFNMLRAGGSFLITTPFLLRYHPDPIDCTRWTAQGLKYFLHECGFELEQIEVFSWGNRECLIANFDKWARYRPKQHSLSNDPDFPLVVWAIAKK